MNDGVLVLPRLYQVLYVLLVLLGIIAMVVTVWLIQRRLNRHAATILSQGQWLRDCDGHLSRLKDDVDNLKRSIKGLNQDLARMHADGVRGLEASAKAELPSSRLDEPLLPVDSERTAAAIERVQHQFVFKKAHVSDQGQLLPLTERGTEIERLLDQFCEGRSSWQAFSEAIAAIGVRTSWVDAGAMRLTGKDTDVYAIFTGDDDVAIVLVDRVRYSPSFSKLFHRSEAQSGQRVRCAEACRAVVTDDVVELRERGRLEVLE